ncbi:hypothetical protein GX48_06337 [Paracoccidioides brasiliensis]|nr:hypothetical protein GX48_06337 [Paracoccidioides brasiliensis]
MRSAVKFGNLIMTGGDICSESGGCDESGLEEACRKSAVTVAVFSDRVEFAPCSLFSFLLSSDGNNCQLVTKDPLTGTAQLSPLNAIICNHQEASLTVTLPSFRVRPRDTLHVDCPAISLQKKQRKTNSANNLCWDEATITNPSSPSTASNPRRVRWLTPGTTGGGERTDAQFSHTGALINFGSGLSPRFQQRLELLPVDPDLGFQSAACRGTENLSKDGLHPGAGGVGSGVCLPHQLGPFNPPSQPSPLARWLVRCAVGL